MMEKIKCPACGSPNVEQIDAKKFQCPYCGTTFGSEIVQKNDNLPPNKNEKEDASSEIVTNEENNTSICDVIGGILWLIGFIDFCGMFFGYDFTGVSWSPIVFAVLGSFFMSGGKKNNND